jgi:hypothetical protein
MTVELAADGTIRLDGDCTADDAEPLLWLVTGHRNATVDWRGCEKAHTAVIQILLAAKPKLRGPPAGEFLQRRITPLIASPA